MKANNKSHCERAKRNSTNSRGVLQQSLWTTICLGPNRRFGQQKAPPNDPRANSVLYVGCYI